MATASIRSEADDEDGEELAERGEKATAVIRPRGVDAVGQLRYTVQEGRWTVVIQGEGMDVSARSEITSEDLEGGWVGKRRITAPSRNASRFH